MIQTATRTAAAVGLLALLTACGGGSDGPGGAPGSDGLDARIMVSAEPPGTQCDAGGSRIDAGLDANRDGVLDAGEVGSTQFVCNGAAGAPGAAGATGTQGDTGATGSTGATGATGAAGAPGVSALVVMDDEPPGSSCTQGGKRIRVGLDADGNGVLDAGEVTSTGFVCHGTPGTNGINGTNGTDGTNGTSGSNGVSTLVSVSAEAAGANCSYGGSRVRSGPDGNANGVLDDGEVTSTSYVCHGAPGPGLVWNVVNGPTQAQVNNGYVATNDYAQVVVTLPPTAAAGQTVRIAGGGAAGWKVAQNAGQTINGRALGIEAGVDWTARDSARDWSAVASSADGNRLIAAEWDGALYTSTDRGLTWTPRRTDAPRPWIWVASSADGLRLVAVESPGAIHTSSDGGVSWSERMADTARSWYSVASSADGQTLVAAESGGWLYVSTDGGVNWTARATDTTRYWSTVAASPDGTRLVAAELNGVVHTSTDGGATWVPRTAVHDWIGLASSADGMRLVAVAYAERIYTSDDGGVSWAARDAARNWLCVASSADGRRLVAVAANDKVYTSTDFGVTWTARENIRDWYGCAISAAGDSIVAVASLASIYASTAWSTMGTAGSVSGGAYDSIELQSLGDGRFNVIGHEGSPTVE